MRLLQWLRAWVQRGRPAAEHLRRGRLGEQAARTFLEEAGLRFLAANVRCGGSELDLVFRDGDCLVFIEVKARSSETWGRPASAVTAEKRRRLSRAAMGYVRRLDNARVKIRFDIVEVLLDANGVREVRHLPCAFPLTSPLRYG